MIIYSFLVSIYAMIVPSIIIGIGILIAIGGIIAIFTKIYLNKNKKQNHQSNNILQSQNNIVDGVATIKLDDSINKSANFQLDVQKTECLGNIYNLESQHPQDKKFCQQLSSESGLYQHYEAQDKKVSIVSPIIDGLTNIVPQIINDLATHAMHREANQKIKDVSTLAYKDVMTPRFERANLPKQYKIEDDLYTTTGIPYWEHTYIYSVADLQAANHLQKQFYRYFKAQFLQGHYLDIEDNSNYAFVLMFDLAEDYKMHKDYVLLKQQLDTLAEKYPIVAQYINRALLNVVATVNQEDAEKALKSFDKSRGQLCQWIKSNEIIEVQGIKLTRGNFYVGECFRLPDSVIKDNVYFGYKGTYIFGPVLNPDLPAGDSNIKNIFCSYYDMSPAWRHQYLMWLSGDIQAADIPTEILLFYLYGCEIRMFIDPQTNNSERKSLIYDLIKLHKSLNEASTGNYILVQQKLCDLIGNAIVKYFRNSHEEFEAIVILGNCRAFQDYIVGQKFASKRTFTPDDAFDIAAKIYDITQIVPFEYISAARRYFFDDFMKLQKDLDVNYEMIAVQQFSVNYFYNGLFNSERVNLYYKIEALPSDLWKVHNAIWNCYYWSIVSKFKRYNQLKKRYDGKETIAAIQVLPDDIDIRELPKIQTLIINIENKMQSENYSVAPIDWLLTQWEYKRNNDKSIHKEYADSIIGGLLRLGYGIVPNYEIDRKRFNFGDICVIYRNKEHYPIKSTPVYDRAELFIKLAAYIVHADNATDSDIAFVTDQLKLYNNTPGNHIHLTAVIRWRFLSKKQPLDKSTKNAIANLTSEHRTTIGNALIRLACINGDIHPKRIDWLKKVLPLLGIEVDNIHSQIHRLLTDKEGFAVVEKKSDAVEFTINSQSAYSQKTIESSVIINPKKLNIFEQQTKAAQKLLSEIFVEEEPALPQNMELDATATTWMKILKSLLAKETWKRVEVEKICQEHGLMMGAVLEQINDFAYEKVDDAVIEDDGENIYVTLDYKEQLI